MNSAGPTGFSQRGSHRIVPFFAERHARPQPWRLSMFASSRTCSQGRPTILVEQQPGSNAQWPDVISGSKVAELPPRRDTENAHAVVYSVPHSARRRFVAAECPGRADHRLARGGCVAGRGAPPPSFLPDLSSSP